MKKKVLYIASEAAPGMIPFAATIINSLACSKKVDIHVICCNTSQGNYRGYLDSSVKVKYIEFNNNPINSLISKIWPHQLINVLDEEIKRIKPSIIHLITGDYSLALYIQLYKRKYIFCYTVHDLHPHEMGGLSLKESIMRHLINHGYKKCMDSASILTTCSYEQYTELQKMYPTKRVCYTHFPTLVTNAIKNGNDFCLDLKGVDKYILFFGSVNEYKGVELLIKAFKNSKFYSTHYLVIAGKGLSFDNDERIIRLNRFIKDSEVAFLFRNATVVVYPYISATMSGVLSLSFYFNKHVILSDIPFFKEYECELTHYFKSKSISDLTEKLNDITEEFTAFSSVYERFYSNNKIEEEYLHLYGFDNELF